MESVNRKRNTQWKFFRAGEETIEKELPVIAFPFFEKTENPDGFKKSVHIRPFHMKPETGKQMHIANHWF